LETVAILKKTASAHRYLAELKGISETIPNQSILINTLTLQEAKESSAIEAIITTQDDLFREDIFPELASNQAAKEVKRYASALKCGFELIKNGLLTTNNIIEIQSHLECNRAGVRKLPGTELKNQATGEVIYIPPQNPFEINDLLKNLEQFINDDAFYDADPLVKMAIIHYQFESIHPFYDGNGRSGRIINVLYLVLKDLLRIPVLYLSNQILRTKNTYYTLLQDVREKNSWEPWVLYMLDCVEVTAQKTIAKVIAIRELLQKYKQEIRSRYSFYSQELINNIFCHPYTKIELLERDCGISRLTASRYLERMTADGFLKKVKFGRSNLYINTELFNLLSAANN